jgi:hypothetical protein
MKNSVDCDGIRQRLSKKGHLYKLGCSDTSYVMSLEMTSGRVITSHKSTEAECLVDLDHQTNGEML